MNEYGYGPNGALIHCMETVVDDYEWFDKAIGDHDGDYLLIDLPGQIELYEIDILLNYYEDADFMDEEVDMNDGDQTGDN
ncbi:hypothetical protein TRFO_41635 [Tritrichomonas foetus]|uniref:GPN-loop GTPase 3 n=1 Tax=Tritrichomonas foetus TaxID=1144522 RepID=A0A1J4KZK6_9EUKA|nr:hypothetical protein TRFO_41635 [Tritrichomonas foetus]|eukprot:OHT16687.1 hypothetical protein TRFO_41635 [Tritrichomonas foetus]